MLGVAVVGQAVNVAGMLLFRQGSAESLNLKGAYFEVLSDMFSSLGVIAAGLIMWMTRWNYADPLFAADIGPVHAAETWILLRKPWACSWRGRRSTGVLPPFAMQSLKSGSGGRARRARVEVDLGCERHERACGARVGGGCVRRRAPQRAGPRHRCIQCPARGCSGGTDRTQRARGASMTISPDMRYSASPDLRDGGSCAPSITGAVCLDARIDAGGLRAGIHLTDFHASSFSTDS